MNIYVCTQTAVFAFVNTILGKGREEGEEKKGADPVKHFP
jgi:hypothetical protein